jgi:acyl-coenzyme A synthetase/AMP-(fatty) acid ligase
MIRTHCQTVMARFMVPKIITILKDMPRTPTGKIEKGKLLKIAVKN